MLVYSAVDSDYREPCLDLLDAVARGGADGRTSPAVLEEVWYLEVSGRVGRLDGLTEHAYTLFTPLLPVTDEAFGLALRVPATGLGTNDRLHLGTCLAHHIGTVVSADAAFDGIRGVRRVDPLDRRALRRLLTAERS